MHSEPPSVSSHPSPSIQVSSVEGIKLPFDPLLLFSPAFTTPFLPLPRDKVSQTHICCPDHDQPMNMTSKGGRSARYLTLFSEINTHFYYIHILHMIMPASWSTPFHVPLCLKLTVTFPWQSPPLTFSILAIISVDDDGSVSIISARETQHTFSWSKCLCPFHFDFLQLISCKLYTAKIKTIFIISSPSSTWSPSWP